VAAYQDLLLKIFVGAAGVLLLAGTENLCRFCRV
jgi:hypothetical protein